MYIRPARRTWIIASMGRDIISVLLVTCILCHDPTVQWTMSFYQHPVLRNPTIPNPKNQTDQRERDLSRKAVTWQWARHGNLVLQKKKTNCSPNII
ncbi:hypothetical protein FKM82_010067 [Ascaphus truei]